MLDEDLGIKRSFREVLEPRLISGFVGVTSTNIPALSLSNLLRFYLQSSICVSVAHGHYRVTSTSSERTWEISIILTDFTKFY